MNHGDLMVFRAPAAPKGPATEDMMRSAVFEAERVIHSSPERIRPVDPALWPLRHHFARGIYGRELHIPAGHYLTGHIHKYSQLNIMSKGDMTVITPTGPKRVQAGFHVVSPAGTKRIAFAHTDTIWTTIHGTDETDLDRIEAFFIAKSEQEYLAFVEQQRLLAASAEQMEV